jgi:hypothetical protein
VTGGVPKYLEEIDPKRGAEENIKRLCFTRGGFLVEEFEQVFSDVFLRDSEFYKKILEILCAGAKEMPAIKRLLTGNQHGRVEQSDRCAHRRIVNDCRALKRVPWIALTAINLRTIMYI